MKEPAWLSVSLLHALHSRQIEKFGGVEGIRDVNLLERAVSRPIHKFAFGETDFAALAAACAFHIARDNPFVEGNNRLAFAAILVFLGLNGVEFHVSDREASVILLALTAGELGEDLVTLWIWEHLALQQAA